MQRGFAMLRLYKILTTFVYGAAWPYLAIKRLRSREEWEQRRALHVERYLPADGSGCLWGHASSVGEVRVLARLMMALKTLRPQQRFCVSTYTSTGRRLARELLPEAEAVFLFPLDGAIPLRRLFRHFHPVGVVMVETEIWPYFLDYCRRRALPVILANGRVSERSFRRYYYFRHWLAPLLTVYRRLAMQTAADADRVIKLGAAADRVIVTGNIKHDAEGIEDRHLRRREIRRQMQIPEGTILFVAASTRPGEEDIVAQALTATGMDGEHLVCLMAPRHLERLDEVKGVLEAQGYQFDLFSDIESGSERRSRVILMDKMGLLAGLFYGADLAFVGGTLADVGGHNVMEPVVAGVPVLFGPSLHNVREAADAIVNQDQGMVVNNGAELADAIRRFHSGALRFRTMATNGTQVADKTAALIVQDLGL